MCITTAKIFVLVTGTCLNESPTQQCKMSDFGEICFCKILNNPDYWHKIRHIGKHTSLGERDEGFKRIEIYRQWFQQTILTGDHTNAIIVMPLEDAAPRYRDDVPEWVTSQTSLHCLDRIQANYSQASDGRHKMVSTPWLSGPLWSHQFLLFQVRLYNLQSTKLFFLTIHSCRNPISFQSQRPGGKVAICSSPHGSTGYGSESIF